MEHKNVRISDAIPQRPASFDNAVEQTLARVCQKEQKQEQQKETPVRAWKTETGTERKRRSWRTVLGGVAIASLVVLCVGAIGMTIALRLRSNKSDPAKENPVITLEPTQEPTPEPSQKPVKIGKSYYLVNNVPVYPYESLLWESGPEYNVDGESVEHKLADEKIRAEIPEIPEAEYVTGMHFTILIKEGWTLDEIAIYNDICERIATVGRSELTVTEQRCTDPECVTTLQPGAYYVSALVENQDEQISKGSEIVIRLLVKEDTDPQPTETTAILEEFTSDSGVDMIKIAVLVPAKATVTIEFPNQSDWVRTNSEDEAQPVRIAFAKAAFAPDASDTKPIVVVEPKIMITTADGESYRVDCPSVTYTFRFWEYDEENGYREAPKEGTMFVCDFDGDGTEEEITYRLDDSIVEITVCGASDSLHVGAELSHVILIDLDPDAAGLNLLVVCNFGSEDYETTELHLKNGKLKKGPTVGAYCEWDGTALRGSRTQTDILGTRFGTRIYRGEDLKPDSEWFDCEHIPTESELKDDRETLMENGVLLHVRRDLPCTIDGHDAVIEQGAYLYVTRWHESYTLAEVKTEDGRTARISVEWQDEEGYTIAGLHQNEYFDSVFYAD